MKIRHVVVLGLLLLGACSCSRNPEVAKRKYLESGNRYFDKKQYKEASIMYRQALRKDPRYGEAYYRLGLTQLRLGRLPEAVRSLRRAVELLPASEDPRVQLANIYLAGLLTTNPANTRDIEFLRGEVKSLAEGLPQRSPHRHRFLGYCLLSQKQLPEAIAEFRAAHQAGPFQPEFTLPLIESLLAADQEEEAEKLARTLIEKQKTFGPSYDVLYAHYVRRNREADAEALLKEKIASIPNQAAPLLQLAAHYHRLKREREMQATLDRLTSNLKQFPNAHLLAGDFYRVRRDLDNALRQYELGAQHDASNKARYQKLKAQVLVDQGKRAEASALLEEVLKQNAQDQEARAMRAALLIETGSPEQVQVAITELQAAVTRSPDNPVLRFNLGRALMRKGEADQARTQFQEAIKRQPNYIPARAALAELHLIKRDFPAALQAAREILQLDPNNLPAKLLRTAALVRMGNLDEARKDVDATIKQHPDSREVQLQLASLNLYQRRFKEAEDLFLKLHQTALPGDLRALMGLTETYAIQGQFQKSIAALQAELAKSERPALRLALANDYVRAGQYDAAIAEYQRLIQQFPKAGDIYLRLGETQRRKGDLNAAAASFRKCTELLPTEPSAYLALAVIQDSLKQHNEAKATYRKLLQIQPDHPVALNNLAYMMAESGEDLDQALALAQRARQKLPQDPNVADTLGWIYIKKNLSDNAVDIFRELTKQQPQNPTFHYHLGIALYQKGDRLGARQALQTALRNKPSAEEAAKIKELMSKVG